MKMFIVRLCLLGAVASALLAVVLTERALNSRPSSGYDFEPDRYTFMLPPTFMGCFMYTVRSNETFSDWDLQQPSLVIIEDVRDVTIRNVRFTLPVAWGCQR